MKKLTSIYLYYAYAAVSRMRLTRIVNIIYLVQYADISLVQFAILQSIYSFSQFAMEVPAGVVGDFLKRKTTVVLGYIFVVIAQLFICSKAIFGIETNFLFLMFGFVGEGVAAALISGADEALFFEGIREDGFADQYDKIVGKNRLIAAISLGAATFIGTVMYDFDFRLPYFGTIIMAVMSMIIILIVKDHTNANELKENSELSQWKKYRRDLAGVGRNSHILFMMFFSCVIFGVINAIFGIMPNYMSQIGFTASENGFVFLVLSIISGGVAMQAFRLSNKTYRQLIMLVSVVMIVGVLFMTYGNNKLSIFAGLAFVYIIIDILDPVIMKIFNSYVSDNIRATFLSLLSFLSSGIMMLVYPIVGFGAENLGMIQVLHWITLVTVVLMLTSSFIYRKLGVVTES